MHNKTCQNLRSTNQNLNSTNQQGASSSFKILYYKRDTENHTLAHRRLEQQGDGIDYFASEIAAAVKP